MRQVFWRQCNSVIVATMVPLWVYLVSKAPGDLTFLVQPILAFDFVKGLRFDHENSLCGLTLDALPLSPSSRHGTPTRRFPSSGYGI